MIDDVEMAEVELLKSIVQLLGQEDDAKLEAVGLMKKLLDASSESGYNLVVLKELNKIVQFDSGELLNQALVLLEEYFFTSKYWDELAETFIYRVGRSTDTEVSKLVLGSLKTLITCMGEDVAKHSKQILKLVDLDTTETLIPINLDILRELEARLPPRLKHRCISCEE